MLLFLAVMVAVAVGVVLAARAMAAGRLPVPVAMPPAHTEPELSLPAAAMAADVDALRLDTALRGYRMAHADALLDELRDRLAGQEAEIARLTAAPDTATDTDTDTEDAVPPTELNTGPAAEQGTEQRSGE